jgi:hypothetical protein
MKRTTMITVGAPVLVGVLGLLVFLAIRSQLPDPVATHWGPGGPNGFTALRWAPLPVLVGAVLGLALGALVAWFGRREPAARRLGAGLGTGRCRRWATTAAGAGGSAGAGGPGWSSAAVRRCR